MQNTNVESAEPTHEVAKVDAQTGVRGRIKHSFALVHSRVSAVEARARAQWVEIPNQIRDAVESIAERVRATLDLPSRAELEQLINRVEELDRQLAALQAGRPLPVPQTTSKSKKKTTAEKTARKPAPKGSSASKTDRKDEIKKAASKRKKS